ncbi:MAG: hypothetical protein EOO40_11260, partial [Deltaproteobacteria bacterium]
MRKAGTWNDWRLVVGLFLVAGGLPQCMAHVVPWADDAGRNSNDTQAGGGSDLPRDANSVVHVGAPSQLSASPQFWVATDALQRTLPSADDVGPRRANRYVGVFYFLTGGFYRTHPIADVTVALAQNANQPAWAFQDWFWGRPESDYYQAADPWAIRRNLQMLANADVDFIFFDFTNNAATYPAVQPLLSVAEQMRAQGIAVPQIAFFVNADGQKTLQYVYDQLYAPGLFRAQWFLWENKPLVLAGPSYTSTPQLDAFFTIRSTWAFQSEQQDQWRFLDDYPQRYGWHSSAAVAEQITVSKAMGAPLVAKGAINNKGASFHGGVVPTYDANMLCPQTPNGAFFEEQWTRAHQI